MSGLWRNRADTPEGKYLVKRRDGSVPNWPWFVIGANDPAAPAALMAYAHAAKRLGMDSDYVQDIFDMAKSWAANQAAFGATGDPDAPPNLIDDPETVAEMRKGNSA
jgi:hypothetical protein